MNRLFDGMPKAGDEVLFTAARARNGRERPLVCRATVFGRRVRKGRFELNLRVYAYGQDFCIFGVAESGCQPDAPEAIGCWSWLGERFS